MKNILVFPCGSEIGLEIYRSLEYSKDIKLFGGSSTDDHGKFVYKNYIDKIPYVTEKNFISQINKIVKKYKIDFIFPAHDSVLVELTKHKDKIDAIIIASPWETCEICRSKKKTYNLFSNEIKTPNVFKLSSNLNYPVFIKPDQGQGSVGTQKVYNYQDLLYAIKKNPDILILEYLPGKEYTIDCFTNKEGKLIFIQGRQRIRISNGISVNSKPTSNIKFNEIAEIINNKIKLRGVWFFQVKEDINGNLSLLEIEPRVAGTMSLSRVQGVNLPLLSFYDFSDKNVNIIKNNYEVEIDRALEAKYKTNIGFYDKVYIDLDDTLIINDMVNIKLISLIYQFINDKKEIILLTKHIKNINNTLKKHRLSKDMFNKIIQIPKNGDKSKFIEKNSIFIDDSFSERENIFIKTKTFVFDLDTIDCLFN